MKTEIQHKQFQATSTPRRRERLAKTLFPGITASAGRFQLPCTPRTNSQLYTLNPQLEPPQTKPELGI